MEILGIGPLEILLILVIALIVLGPKEMVNAGATVGKFIRKIRNSETWQGFQRMSRSLKSLPEDLVRQTGIEELRKDISSSISIDENRSAEDKKISTTEQGLKAWTQSPNQDNKTLGPGKSITKESHSTKPKDDQDN